MNEQYIVTWSEVYERIQKLGDAIKQHAKDKPVKVYGIPRGGSIVVGVLAAMVKDIIIVMDPKIADIIIDDIYDSGTTAKGYEKYKKQMIFLYDKRTEYNNTWVVFPWEGNPSVDVEDNVRRLLQFIGEDTSREGLLETPKRYVKFLTEFTNPPEFKCTAFDSEGMDEMIVQTDISFYSFCEHHLAPFFGEGYIAYIPNGKIIGLSKLARTLEFFSRRPQNQERITTQVAEYLQEKLDPIGVGVVLRARHMCMEMRGVEKPGVFTTTSKMIGQFKQDLNTKHEFLKLIRLNGK